MEKGKYLDSWKDIAAYLGRNIRTCRNWERDLGLPVHRLDDSPKSHVFAYTGEIDAWREMKGRLPDNEENGGDDREAANRPRPPQTVPIRRSVRAWAVAALLAGPFLAIIATVLITRHLRPTGMSAVDRSIIKVEPGHWLEGRRELQGSERPTRTAMAISGDGRFVVYSAIEENPGPQARPWLFLRRMDKLEARRIAGTEGGINPFLAPDDRWVGFWADGKLKKVPVEGGVPITLCELPPWFYGASWGPDSIVFSDTYDAGLSVVSAAGGKPEVLTKPDPKREEYSHRLPTWLADGKAVLFTVMRHAWDTHPWLALLRLDTREWRVLLQDAADARYVPSGHLVFLRQGVLMAVRFDLASMELIGQPAEIVENVMQAFSTGSWFHSGAGQFSTSATGSLIYAAGGLLPEPKDSLVWVDQRGVEQRVTDKSSAYGGPRLSPDGQRIAYIWGRDSQVFVYDLGAGTNCPLTVDGFAGFPIWSPDGRQLLFPWMKSLVWNLFWQPYDGSSPMVRLTNSENFQLPSSWHLDGKTVAIVELRSDADFDIALLDVSSGRVKPFLDTQFNELFPDFSPDGRWIAYTSDESKRNEVYVRAFPGPGLKQLISSEGGEEPLWARNGKQLFFTWEDQVWVVDVKTDSGFAASKPRLLFKKPGYAGGYPVRNYDLSFDGQRFLMVKLEQPKPTPVTEMILVQNWFEELKRLVPTGK